MRSLLLILLWLGMAPALSAQGSLTSVQQPLPTMPAANTANAPSAFEAVRVTAVPEIDGRVNDEIWNEALPIEGFTQREPDEGQPATQRTVVKVLYGDAALFVSARMYDTAPDSIVARLGRRDADVESDGFVIFLDPYNDKRSGFYFGINAAGTLYDGVLYNDGWDDNSWDGVWQGKAARDEEGWSAEFRIPYSQLRFRDTEAQTWGMNFRRSVARRQELSYFVFVPRNESGFVSRFREMKGISGIRQGRQLEIVPYVTARAEYTQQPAGNPFNDGSSYASEAGADLKLGLTSNLTLNATINPDFGQVEVDPAVVNLSDRETFFPEKRPFFVEGSSIFAFGYGGANSNWGFNWGNPDFFYSRRVGRAPQGSEGMDYEYRDRPQGTRILGATKLTGKVGGMNLGVIGSVTGRGVSTLQHEGNAHRVEVEPVSFYGVARAQREFNGGRQGLGFISTLTRRDFREETLRDQINDGALTTGIDGWTQFGPNQTWALTGWAGLSHVSGTAERIARLQRSPLHYLHRPDLENASYDPTRTSLTGFGGRVALNKQRGNGMFNAALGVINPYFNLNDAGYQWRSDVINAHVAGGYRWNEVSGPFRQRTVMGSLFSSWNFDGLTTMRGLWTRMEAQFVNYYRLSIGGAVNPKTYNATLTRGGPVTRNPAGVEFSGFGSTDSRKAWQLSAEGYGYASESGNNWTGYLGVTWQPAPSVNLSLGPQLSRNVRPAQYVSTVQDVTATETFGHRYVFASLDQWTAAANVRLNWTFTPTMSLQFFAQPLLAAGAYDEFKELARPRTFSFDTYGQDAGTITLEGNTYTVDPDGSGAAAPFTIGAPDFRFASLRGNAVFRWEYRPGSTLYLVWTQLREDFEQEGAFTFDRSFSRLLDARPDNVFMLKLTYWLGR